MRTTRNKTENYVIETIDRIVRNTLLEMAYNNMTFKEFERDMRALGFMYREAEGSSKVFYIPKYGDNSSFTVHVHDDNAKVDGNALRQVKDVLKSIGWFNDPQNYSKFPFEKWGISNKDIVVDTTRQDI